jgi:hypothetical protein
MSCINDILCGSRTILGVRDFADCNQPESGMFINDLPGMSLRNAAAIASEEYQTGANLLKEKIKFAMRAVVNDFQDIIAAHFDFNAIVANRELHYFDTTLLPSSAQPEGLKLSMWRSEMAKIYIESVYIQVANSGVAILKITDGDIVKQYEVSLQANVQNKIRIDYKAQNEDVYLTIADASLQKFTGNIHNRAYYAQCGGCQGGGDDLVVMGWDGTKETSSYYGIGVAASVRCYEENAICKLLPRMYFLLLYRAGIEIVEESMRSTRINNVVSFSSDKKEWRNDLWVMYNKEKKNLATNAKTFLRSLKGDCITCNSMRHVQSTP